MSRKEKKELIKSMDERYKKATASKKAALDYLIRLGVLKKNGKPTKNYNELCITPTQG
jgi:hypothetical protein